MIKQAVSRLLLLAVVVVMPTLFLQSQTGIKPRFSNSRICTGIEVGSKGVKMSVIEMGNNAKSSGAFYILKDTSVNTDFISFTPATFSATLNGFTGLYTRAIKDYMIPAKTFSPLSAVV
ncbi:MAG: hypothetical protein IPM85_05130 [Chitinophagaceae bacterium]|nr:hypothetical protein [Chitinophagaceae bacterium]